MSRTKKNRKSNRRGTAVTRSAQPRARRDGAQASATATPPGLLPAKSAAPGLLPAKSAAPGLVRGQGFVKVCVTVRDRQGRA